MEELRDRIIRVALILGATWSLGWFFFVPIYGFFNAIVARAAKSVPKSIEFREVFHNMTEPFLLQIKLSFFFGFIIAFPFIIMQIWGFIAPGLKKAEREPLTKIAPWSIFLFFLGAGFAWLVLPTALVWFITYVSNYTDVSIFQEAGTMTFFILKMLFAFGLAFQLPLVVYILGALRLLTAETLLKYWRQTATAIFVLAMIITPSQDPATMLMMAIPLCLLFMISVYLVKWMQSKNPVVEDEVQTESNYLLPEPTENEQEDESHYTY